MEQDLSPVQICLNQSPWALWHFQCISGNSFNLSTITHLQSLPPNVLGRNICFVLFLAMQVKGEKYTEISHRVHVTERTRHMSSGRVLQSKTEVLLISSLLQSLLLFLCPFHCLLSLKMDFFPPQSTEQKCNLKDCWSGQIPSH